MIIFSQELQYQVLKQCNVIDQELWCRPVFSIWFVVNMWMSMLCQCQVSCQYQ